MICYAIALTAAETMQGEEQKQMLGFLRANAAGTVAMKKIVKSCATEKMHDPNFKRLMVCLAPTNECQAMLDKIVVEMSKAGIEEQFHTAPACYLESELQRERERERIRNPMELRRRGCGFDCLFSLLPSFVAQRTLYAPL